MIILFYLYTKAKSEPLTAAQLKVPEDGGGGH